MISAVLLIGFIIQYSQPYFVQDDLYDYSLPDSIFKKLSSDSTMVKQKAPLEKSKVEKEKPTKRKKKSLTHKSININTASQKELEILPRIGPATAKNIIKYREENGPFKSFEDIKKVKRIGPKTLEKIKPFITLNDL